MQRFRRVDAGLTGELVCLLLAAPPLYFPTSFPAWATPAALLLLGAGWLWRRRTLGTWLVRTPADWPIFLLFGLLLPVSVWVAPPGLREQYALPRALILLWNFCLLWTVASHSGRNAGARNLLAAGFVLAGVAFALVAIFGTQWVAKLPLLAPLLERIPRPLLGRFAGAEEGFSPNQLAGTLLYVLPFLLALWVAELRTHRRLWLLAAGGAAGAIMGLVLLASQSRSGYVGLAAALAVLLLGPWRWGRWLLATGAIGAVVLLLVIPVDTLLVDLDISTTLTAGAGVPMAARLEIWQRALYGIHDFPLTGMGLGTFRQVGPQLYPLFLLPPTYDIAHAHNFFLQSALDFGLPGLVALLTLYLLASGQGISLWRAAPFAGSRGWALGLLAALAGQAVYSLADAVAMGSKTNLLFWFLLALIFGLTARPGDKTPP